MQSDTHENPIRSVSNIETIGWIDRTNSKEIITSFGLLPTDGLTSVARFLDSKGLALFACVFKETPSITEEAAHIQCTIEGVHSIPQHLRPPNWKRTLHRTLRLPTSVRALYRHAQVLKGSPIIDIDLGGRPEHPTFGMLNPSVGDAWSQEMGELRRGRYILALFGGCNPFHGKLQVHVATTTSRNDGGISDWYCNSNEYLVCKTSEVDIAVSGPVVLHGTVVGRNERSQGYWICLTQLFLVSIEDWHKRAGNLSPMTSAQLTELRELG